MSLLTGLKGLSMKIKLEDLRFDGLTVICGENLPTAIDFEGDFNNYFYLTPERAVSVLNISVTTFKKIAKNKSFIARVSEIQNPDSSLYQEILGLFGKIINGKFTILEEVEFLSDKKSIPIKESSSFVRSLLHLECYLFNLAKIGDPLIIEEPEIYSHPKNQILMSRLLVLLVNAGIGIIITTHSDYIIRELSNCIMLDNLNGEQILTLEKQGYNENYALNASKVRSYLVESGGLRPTKVTKEQGIFVETFDEPIDSQNENQGLIFEMGMKNINRKEKK